MSVDDLARRVGVRVATVERWEDGTLLPGAHRLSKLAGILGVGLSWLMVGRGEHPIASNDVDAAELARLVATARDQIGEAMSTLQRVERQIAADD